MDDLREIIRRIIQSNREGTYWDFKREPHANNASFLHDILCLANCQSDGNRYLIFGVSDSSKGCEVVGLDPNQTNRRTQANIVDFLNKKAFAGDVRPKIALHTIIVDGREVDVLEIFNLPLKPYYLTEIYADMGKKVNAYHIYTRTNDANTPLDKGADFHMIEAMWRERFGLDLPPLARLKYLLREPNKWVIDLGNIDYAYHEQFSDFRIEFSDTEEFWEVYSFFYPNEKSFLGTATFKFNSTILAQTEYMCCDEMRIYLTVPKTASIELGRNSNWYFFYELDSLEGHLLNLLTDGVISFESRIGEPPFLVFEDKSDRQKFNEFAKGSEELFESILPSFFATDAKRRMKDAGKQGSIDPEFCERVYQLYKQWCLTIAIQ